MLLIIAPTFIEARDFAGYHQIPKNQWRHVTNRHDSALRGLWKPKYVLLNEYAVRDLHEIEQELRVMGAESWWDTV